VKRLRGDGSGHRRGALGSRYAEPERDASHSQLTTINCKLGAPALRRIATSDAPAKLRDLARVTSPEASSRTLGTITPS
jgi:hypothetical protein